MQEPLPKCPLRLITLQELCAHTASHSRHLSFHTKFSWQIFPITPYLSQFFPWQHVHIICPPKPNFSCRDAPVILVICFNIHHISKGDNVRIKIESRFLIIPLSTFKSGTIFFWLLNLYEVCVFCQTPKQICMLNLPSCHSGVSAQQAEAWRPFVSSGIWRLRTGYLGHWWAGAGVMLHDGYPTWSQALHEQHGHKSL